jgi:hypothetical protein
MITFITGTSRANPDLAIIIPKIGKDIVYNKSLE